MNQKSQKLGLFLDESIPDVRARHGLPALGVAMLYDGTVIKSASGVRKLGDPTPVTAEDKFHLGSCSKAITATVIHQLIDEGLFRQNSTLGELFPSLEINPGYRNITVSQLLTHTSGLPAQAPVLTKLQETFAGRPVAQQRRDILKTVITAEPSEQGAGSFQYSNLGYVLLGAIAEQATGISLEDLVRQRVFKPLDMLSAGFGCCPAETDENAPPDQPWGHYREKDEPPKPVNFDNPPAFAPAGTMHASMGDWMKFLKSRLNHWKNNKRLPAAAAMGNGCDYTDEAFMHAPTGIMAHDGSNRLNYSRAIVFPEDEVIVILVTNDGSPHALAAMDEMTTKIKSRLAELDAEIPKPPRTKPTL